MAIDSCEPVGFAAVLFGLGDLVAGALLGVAVAMVVRRFSGPQRGWRLWSGGLTWFVVALVLVRQFAKAMYSTCEMAAWGLAPDGAILAIFLISPAAFIAYLLVVRRGSGE